MMRHVRSIGLAAVALFLLAACSDLPTMNAPTPDLTATLQVQAECGTYDNPCLLPPVSSDPVEPGCPWCYSGPCETSLPGSPETMGVESGCDPGGSPTGPGDGGGAGTPGPGDGETQPCPDWDPACQSPPADHSNDEEADCLDLGCNLRDPTTQERQKVLDAINNLREDGFCADVKANALAMVNRRLQVWENRVYAPNDQGKMALLLGEAPWDMDLLAPIMYLWTGAINGWTIAHEAIHGLPNPNSRLGDYYTHSAITPLGMNLDDTAKYCSRN